MKIVVAGGSGWLGRALCTSLAADGHEVVVLSRRALDDEERGAHASPRLAAATRRWDGRTLGPWADEIDGAHAVINLAGESIAEKRWTPGRKRVLLASRIEPTRALVAAIEHAARRPAVLVNMSAVGYYGHRGGELLTEEEPPGTDFLAALVVDWEEAARQAEGLGVRVVLARTGVVLGKGGGALPRLALPFRLFVGGPIGSGREWFPWVHLDDVIGLLRFVLERPEASGPINLVAPEPVTMADFAEAVGRVLRRPSWLPVAWFALRLVLGEIADALMVSQRVVPARAQQLGFEFRQPALLGALQSAVG